MRTIPPQNSRPLLRSASERNLEAFAGVLSRFCRAPSLAAEVHKSHSTLLPYSSITVFVGAALVSLEILVGESELFGCFLRLSNYCPEASDPAKLSAMEQIGAVQSSTPERTVDWSWFCGSR